ncbi:putative ORFan [Tupanvirus deep ocean]|uniref:ORFan n=2 Tax=Tupanvirus TaxID=2094720 RepID=A0AC62A7G0_9VIRU|nr:putative ORFan [Tupanvirus deep ocean]QKU33563.1 putative ORFan [Tupanvirus deep ocean]
MSVKIISNTEINFIMTNIEYAKVEDQKLSAHLKTVFEAKVIELFDAIKKYLLDHSANGRTELKIYFPKLNESVTFNEKDITVNGFYDSISDEYLQHKLYKKFKSEGVKLIVDTAYCRHDQYNMYPLRRTGLIFHFKWKRDYSKNRCIIQ